MGRRWHVNRLGGLGRARSIKHGWRGDARRLEREGDPRGGFGDERYRTAGPADLVEADGVVMAGPGGAAPPPDAEAGRGDPDPAGGGGSEARPARSGQLRIAVASRAERESLIRLLAACGYETSAPDDTTAAIEDYERGPAGLSTLVALVEEWRCASRVGEVRLELDDRRTILRTEV